MKIKASTLITAAIVFAILGIIGYAARPYIPFLAAMEEERRAGGQRGAPPRAATAVRVTPVANDTIANSVVLNGDVLAENQISIFPIVGGTITQTYFQVGDRINQGTVVAMVDPSRPGQIFSESPVVSTIGGTVLRTPVSRGDTVSAQTAVIMVGDLSTLAIETDVPERFSTSAQRGLTADVSLDALPGEIFQAVVHEVSPVLDPRSRTVRIRLRFEGRADPRIKAGMFATVSLVTSTRQNVPVIPRTAIINTQGSMIVFTVDEENIASRKEIFLGIENENFVEVIAGLEAGDLVVSAGHNFLSQGDPVRILN